MVSPVITEHFYTGAFMVREAPGYASRDTATLSNATGADVEVAGGQVLALLESGTPVATPGPGNHGNGTVGTISAGSGVLVGAYTLVAASATVFDVTDPNGNELPPATVGTAYVNAEISFTITAGGTAFQAGDTFAIAAGGGYVSYTGAAGQVAAAIAYNRGYVPAGGTKAFTIITRNAEVNSAELQWDPALIASGNAAQLQAEALSALRARGIVAR